MMQRFGSSSVPALRCLAGALAVTAAFAFASIEDPAPAPAGKPLPVGETLGYAVSWSGIHCGAMEIVSFRENGPNGEPQDRIVVLLRSSRFFDGIYRVRSRLDSTFIPSLGTSTRYRERSQEKKRRKDELWEVDAAGGQVVRHRKDKVVQIPIERDRVLDPLAFIFSLRTMPTEVGAEATFNLMTDEGDVPTVARVTEAKTIKIKRGRCNAVAIVPEPRDEMLLSKSGAMVVWVETERPHRPCRVEFDLSFGKLVASLRSVSEAGGEQQIRNWETWDE